MNLIKLNGRKSSWQLHTLARLMAVRTVGNYIVPVTSLVCFFVVSHDVFRAVYLLDARLSRCDRTSNQLWERMGGSGRGDRLAELLASQLTGWALKIQL